jgi:4-amino-4-deoxy-L-arabinose transferase-like glycosyltransferase
MPTTADAESASAPAGNPLRLRALALVLTASVAAVAVMASGLSPRAGVPLALVTALVATVGILDLLGSFDDVPRAPGVALGALALPAGGALVGAGALLGLVRAAVDGTLPALGAAVGLPAAFVACVAGLFGVGARLGPWRLDEDGRPRPLHRRHGFWLLALASVLYLPTLGHKSLVDPWETHYGEVAREILARDDWLSLWWAQEGWFWSKPVLTFWLEAGAMALGGVRYEPGRMLERAGEGLSPAPELALRMPMFLAAVLALYLSYRAVARLWGRRAGFLGGLVLLTMPQFFFVAHQAMTDMPFVAGAAAALALFLLAVRTDPDEPVRVHALRVTGGFGVSLSLYHLVVGAALVVVLPQLFYLFSRNVVVAWSPYFDVRLAADAFAAGSPGNCGLPGNDPCRRGLVPALPSLEPAVQALLWLQVLALFLWLSWGERRRQRLLALAAWLCAALATLAKGPAGLLLPALAVLAWIALERRWRALPGLEIPAGVLLFAAAALPWFLAMFVRHGQAFTDRLLFHDMFKRAFGHVHDTNQGDDVSFRYYLWQLGYATFPWTGLAAAGVLRAFGAERTGPRRDATLVLGAWLVCGFALVTWMGTKFHHYCLPLCPPAAMLTGVLLDALWGGARRNADPAALGAAGVAGALVVLLVGRDLAWDPQGRLGEMRLLHLFTYNYARGWPAHLDFSPSLLVATLAAAAATAALVWPAARRAAVAALGTVAVVFSAWALDVYLVRLAPHWGQRELLFAYERERRERPGPIAAYQMNWKGENFYRGNAIAAFVSTGRKFQSWVDDEKRRGVKRFYFLVQHDRLRALRGELGDPRHVEPLTDERLNNKFLLVRVSFD